MSSALLLASSIFALSANLSPSPTVRRIDVVGNLHFPSQTVRAWLAEEPGKPFSATEVRRDLEMLHGRGVFQAVEIESRDVAPGVVDLVVRVRERPFVSSFSIAGVDGALEDLIGRHLHKERLEIQPGIAYRPDQAKKAAESVRRVLMTRKHPLADVRVNCERYGDLVQVVLVVDPGPKIGIGEVQFQGTHSIPTSDLLRKMGNSRPESILTAFTGAGRYLPDELETNLGAVERLYRSHGYARATVGRPEVVTREFPARRLLLTRWASRDSQKIAMLIPVAEGSVYTTRSVRLEGDAGAAGPEVSRLVAGISTPGQYDYESLEAVREKILAALGRRGYALARVDLEQQFDDAARDASAVFRISAGYRARVGRIEFNGNRRLPDKFLRRELRVTEGEVYDSSRLDKSIQRLNRSGLIQEMRRDDVDLRAHPERGTLDVVFKVREKDRHGIYGTGGLNGLTGGYLGAIYSAFNLLGLGEKLSFELDGGSAQSNALLDLAMNQFMGGPFSLGLSLVHRATGFNASSIVPGPSQVANFLRTRSTGGSVRGAYHLSSQLSVGLGVQMEKDSTFVDGTATDPGSWKTTPRATLQPTVLFDSTGGTEHPERGVQLLFTPSWSAPSPLKAIDATQQSARLRLYAPDPLGGGRNKFAFQLVGIATRPLGGSTLPIERRLFPADELLRGFAHGTISPWSRDPANSDSGLQLQPAGADTVLGASSEYRVPLYGPVSGAAFVDFGWIGLDPRNLDPPSTIVTETNNLLRASTGAELRVMIPGLHQPARLIFAWNPLRLNTRTLADPARSIRFALGNVF